MALASAPRVESVGGKGGTAAVSAGDASIADANVLINERKNKRVHPIGICCRYGVCGVATEKVIGMKKERPQILIHNLIYSRLLNDNPSPVTCLPIGML